MQEAETRVNYRQEGDLQDPELAATASDRNLIILFWGSE